MEAFDFSHWKSKSSFVDYLYYFVETILYTVFFSYFVITTLSVSFFVFKILLFIGEREELEFGLPEVNNPSDYTSLPRIFFVSF